MNNYEKWKSENKLEDEVDILAKVISEMPDPFIRCSVCPAKEYCRNKFPGNQDKPWLDDLCSDVVKEWANQTSS